MYILDIIPTTKIPHTQQQVFSYFSGHQLPPGALVQIPLGKRKELGLVFDAHAITDYKMEIKWANFELRNISQVVSAKPILTKQQIALALWLGQYYFCSPGLFVKMCLPKQLTINNKQRKVAWQPRCFTQSTIKRQTLIITPTIAQAEKIAADYKGAILWHSGLKPKQLNEVWWQVRDGQAQTIVGTRSAVFLPFANLKKIVIEDESNPSHKSWDMWPHYSAITAAQKLAEIFKIKPITTGRGHECRAASRPVKGARTGMAWLPKTNGRALLDPPVQIIDMRAELKNGNFSIFSRALQNAIKDALARNQQIILFINRRGAANFILCRDCGYVAKCPNCDTPLAHHLINGRPTLLCHHCGAKDAPPSLCPKCQGSRVKTIGAGTQKVELEAQKFFPNAKTARLDSDIAPKPKNQQKIIDAFAKNEIDILITTQIIFSWLSETKKTAPNVVAVLSADTLLHLPDFRSGERTWQTIMALRSVVASVAPLRIKNNAPRPAAAGLPPLKLRGGEGELLQNNNKAFIVQTYNPDNSVMKYLAQNDWAGFAKEERETRQALNYPPFSQIVKLTFRHRDHKKAGQEAKILAAKLKNAIAKQNNPEHIKNNAPQPAAAGLPPLKLRGGEGELLPDIEISAALPAFIPRERGRYIWNIIIKFKTQSSKLKTSSEFLRRRNSLLQYIPQNWEIEIDPENLL